MKSYLINFAHNYYHQSQIENAETALTIGGFTDAIKYSFENIDQTFLKKNYHILSKPRGAGYWLWKPYFILKTLLQIEYGDILFYCDSGCTFTGSFNDYFFSICNDDKNGLILFQGLHISKKYTKRDCFVYMNCDKPAYTDTNQIIACHQLCRKTDFAIEFYKELLIYAEDERVITDLPNTCGLPNYDTFIDHRHDQSILSNLAKKYNVTTFANPSQFGNERRENGFKQLIYHHRRKNVLTDGVADHTESKRAIARIDSQPLELLGKKYGTDKVNHGFCALYDEEFSKLRPNVNKVLEIGVFFGASLLMWRDWFPNAIIHGADHFTGYQGNGIVFENADQFQKEVASGCHERIVLHQLDQSRREELLAFADKHLKGSFDIIIEDASHLMRDQQQTLAVLFQLVKPGGAFVIEDLHSSLSSGYDVSPDGGNSTMKMIETALATLCWRSEYITKQESDFLEQNIDLTCTKILHSGNSFTCVIRRKSTMTSAVDIASEQSRYQFMDVGFHNDRYLIETMDMTLGKSSFFIETGTNVGSSLSYLAKRYPDIACLSCEPDEEAFKFANQNTPYPNAYIFNETSQKFLQRLYRDYRAFFDKVGTFWLDAHGYGFEWPLQDELYFITRCFSSGFIFIDDFKVPHLQDLFTYDNYLHYECSLDFILASLNHLHNYTIYYPNYTDRTSTHHPLVGWGLIVFGNNINFEITNELSDKLLFNKVKLHHA